MRLYGVFFLFVFLLTTHLIQAQTVGDSHFGFLGPGDPSYNPNYYTEYTNLGVLLDRPHPGPFVWEIVESEQGSYNWNKTDSLVRSAQEANVHMLVTIWPYAEWDQEFWRQQANWEASGGFEKDLPESRYKPNDSTAYKNWIAAMVERYDGDGTDDMPGLTLPLKYWETINEPESADWEELNFFKGDESDYFDVLRWTYNAIIEADENAIILHGGSTGVGDEYWQQVFNMGGVDYFHISNTHAITPPPQVTDLRANQWATLISNFGIEDFWVTEVEIAQNGEQSYSQREVAEQIIKQYVKAFEAGGDKIFYAHIYGDSDSPDFLEAALIEVLDYENWQEEKREAYYALQTLISKIDFFDAVEALNETQIKFTVGEQTVYVLWGNGMVPNEIQGSVTVTDYLGNESQMEASNIQLNSSPVFVEASVSTSNEWTENPASFKLNAYPNPFNPNTNISFTIPESDRVTLSVYDITGKHVRTIVDNILVSGDYDYKFNANGLSSGVYFYRITTSTRIETRKFTLLK
ncbi:MAG: T9SS type A sorting domain-containing protein [Balneolaceae bacterium]|nr:T9SS type A sorting domain-containing protein [Balneolaceae bacterium]MBO6546629.1 T9SS type A sorting domain-containing protein [Balneolaceae bacterium]MBO6648987.1 T9SS type A sorting domain-containing protein [Balneolaceae bacterium]